jgi:hypothetical protein
MKTMTAAQARFIALTLEALDALPFYADGQYLRVDLMDELFEAPIGHFTNEEGTWLFEIGEPKPRPVTMPEIAQALFDSNPEHYRDRKINFIKDLREQWNLATGMILSLVDSKNAVEKVLADDALDRLREKLTTSPYGDDYSDPDEDRAYAEHRERMAERGTWFGAPGPLDEEPF